MIKRDTVSLVNKKPTEPRGMLHVRLSPDAIAVIDRLAGEQRRSRSEMARLMLRYAQQQMPKGWVG